MGWVDALVCVWLFLMVLSSWIGCVGLGSFRCVGFVGLSWWSQLGLGWIGLAKWLITKPFCLHIWNHQSIAHLLGFFRPITVRDLF